MNFLLALVMVPLHFTAPADTVGMDGSGQGRLILNPAHAYVFHRIDESGTLTRTPGYADSAGVELLTPHAPGTRETAWVMPGANGRPVTIYVMSLDRDGNLSAPSNRCVIGRRPAALAMRRQVAAKPVKRESRGSASSPISRGMAAPAK